MKKLCENSIEIKVNNCQLYGGSEKVRLKSTSYYVGSIENFLYSRQRKK